MLRGASQIQLLVQVPAETVGSSQLSILRGAPVLARAGASPSECSSRVSQSGSTTNGRKQCALVGCRADTRSRQRGSCASRALPVHKIEADTAGWLSRGLAPWPSSHGELSPVGTSSSQILGTCTPLTGVLMNHRCATNMSHAGCRGGCDQLNILNCPAVQQVARRLRVIELAVNRGQGSPDFECLRLSWSRTSIKFDV